MRLRSLFGTRRMTSSLCPSTTAEPLALSPCPVAHSRPLAGNSGRLHSEPSLSSSATRSGTLRAAPLEAARPPAALLAAGAQRPRPAQGKRWRGSRNASRVAVPVIPLTSYRPSLAASPPTASVQRTALSTAVPAATVVAACAPPEGPSRGRRSSSRRRRRGRGSDDDDNDTCSRSFASAFLPPLLSSSSPFLGGSRRMAPVRRRVLCPRSGRRGAQAEEQGRKKEREREREREASVVLLRRWSERSEKRQLTSVFRHHSLALPPLSLRFSRVCTGTRCGVRCRVRAAGSSALHLQLLECTSSTREGCGGAGQKILNRIARVFPPWQIQPLALGRRRPLLFCSEPVTESATTAITDSPLPWPLAFSACLR